MRRIVFLLVLAIGFASQVRSEEPKLPEGFVALFNGKDLKGMKTHAGPLESWGVENGILFTTGKGGGWLMSEEQYKDFELIVEYKVPKVGNSGIALRSPLQGDPAYTGMEIQLLDDPNYKGLKEWQHTGSIYGVVPSKDPKPNPPGEWNTMHIVAKGRQIKVILNEKVLVDANLDEHKSEAKTHPGILREEGHVGVQNHGNRVEFKRIWVKKL